MNREERRRREREALKSAPRMFKSPRGRDYAVGRQVGTVAEPDLMAKVHAYMADWGAELMTAAHDGYQELGRGGVIVEVEDVSALDRPATRLATKYLSKVSVDQIQLATPDMQHFRQLIDEYDPAVHAVVAVFTHKGVFSSRLSIEGRPPA